MDLLRISIHRIAFMFELGPGDIGIMVEFKICGVMGCLCRNPEVWNSITIPLLDNKSSEPGIKSAIDREPVISAQDCTMPCDLVHDASGDCQVIK
jgi:hypothetical protein